MHQVDPRRRANLLAKTGQTSAEYMGVLLLAAVVVGSLFGSGLADPRRHRDRAGRLPDRQRG